MKLKEGVCFKHKERPMVGTVQHITLSLPTNVYVHWYTLGQGNFTIPHSLKDLQPYIEIIPKKKFTLYKMKYGVK